jgi:phospholipid-binding lipoprotein MlaA
MNRHSIWTLALLLGCGASQADELTQTNVDADGFKRPLDSLQYNMNMMPRDFEDATLVALNADDPWESWNRRVYHFNYRFDEWVALPIVHGYEYVTPSLVRTGVSNFFSNLGEVTNLFNSALQLKGERAMNATARFLFNTTFGIAGLWDVATPMGLPKQTEDFGQTLGHYGVPSGPYLMLPMIGPSSLRDASGLVTDYVAEYQANVFNISHTTSNHPEITGLRLVDKRYTTMFSYDQVNTPFAYDTLRYLYTESRELQVRD